MSLGNAHSPDESAGEWLVLGTGGELQEGEITSENMGTDMELSEALSECSVRGEEVEEDGSAEGACAGDEMEAEEEDDEEQQEEEKCDVDERYFEDEDGCFGLAEEYEEGLYNRKRGGGCTRSKR